NLLGESNTLYLSDGPGKSFVDATAMSGLAAPSLPYTGFGTVAFDIDQDGDLDLGVVNGGVTRKVPLPGVQVSPPWNAYAEPNHIYLNDGHARFTLTPAPSFTDPIEVSRGLAIGDYDGDGDLDMLVN